MFTGLDLLGARSSSTIEQSACLNIQKLGELFGILVKQLLRSGCSRVCGHHSIHLILGHFILIALLVDSGRVLITATLSIHTRYGIHDMLHVLKSCSRLACLAMGGQ